MYVSWNDTGSLVFFDKEEEESTNSSTYLLGSSNVIMKTWFPPFTKTPYEKGIVMQ